MDINTGDRDDPAALAFERIVDDCLNRSWVLEPPVLLRGVHARIAREIEETNELDDAIP
jgi:hypothetical protein